MVGLVDTNKKYIGRLCLLLDFDSWIKSIGQTVSHMGLIAVLTNIDNDVLAVSDGSISNWNNKNYTFTHDMVIEPYSYKLVYGYNNNFLYNRLIKHSSLTWCIFLLA
jgi:hypothetical protein